MSRRAAVIDIDGVLVRGSVAVPGAADALGTLCAHGVPHVFVTNGGGDKRAKARKLAAALATPALDEVYFHTRLVSCHDPMQTLLTDDDHILVLGHDEADAKAVIEEWGRAHNAFAWESLHATHSWLWPSHDAGAPVAELPRRVSAICMVATPHDWGQSLQLCCDLLRHNGWLLPEGRPGAPVRFYVSNPDFDYRARAPVVRMTSGAWVSCLRALLERYNCSFDPIYTGKPYEPIYSMALRALEAQQPDQPLGPIVAIGDNPVSDIRGARRIGARAVLVLTGCAGADDPLEPADAVCRDVGEAVAKELLNQ